MSSLSDEKANNNAIEGDISLDLGDILKFAKEENDEQLNWYNLNRIAENVLLVKGFNELLSLSNINITLYPHQLEGVQIILKEMDSRALIADEVGLGKTIEAGTVLTELMIRGLVNNTIIITPSSLVEQWYSELLEKFNLDFQVNSSGKSSWDEPYIITSINIAINSAEKILKRKWDMVVLDEAHAIKNRNTKSWKMFNSLEKKYVLFLTGTPMQNKLEELFNLITNLRPGLLGTPSQFKKNFIGKTARVCKNPLELRRLISQVMVRRRRKELKGLKFPNRVANTIQFELNPSELELYHELSDYIIGKYKECMKSEGELKNKVKGKKLKSKIRLGKRGRNVWIEKFTLMLLQRRTCSSSLATFRTLGKMIKNRKEKGYQLEILPTLESLKMKASKLINEKGQKLINLENILGRLPAKCVIFTEFADTLEYIIGFLRDGGYEVSEFSGRLSSKKRAATIKQFKEKTQVMVSTDSGSEGLNLQFCNVIINYDLPWNPMRLEQRIGRIHRLTQKFDDVFIYNFSSRNTIEEYVLSLIFEKIGMFKTVLGDIEDIIGAMAKVSHDGRSSRFETTIMEHFVKYGHSAELKKELEEMVAPITNYIDSQDEINQNILDVDYLVKKY